MTRIGLISDTHNYLDQTVFTHFQDCDEIWHAGDIGNRLIADQLADFRPLKAVHGNIDGADVRHLFPERQQFACEDVPVLMVHIGGYPGRYAAGIKNEIIRTRPLLFISGHSHILKVIYDKETGCLHMNPGAAGRTGWHHMRTIIRFAIDGNIIQQCEVIELGKK